MEVTKFRAFFDENNLFTRAIWEKQTSIGLEILLNPDKMFFFSVKQIFEMESKHLPALLQSIKNGSRAPEEKPRLNGFEEKLEDLVKIRLDKNLWMPQEILLRYEVYNELLKELMNKNIPVYRYMDFTKLTKRSSDTNVSEVGFRWCSNFGTVHFVKYLNNLSPNQIILYSEDEMPNGVEVYCFE